MSWLFQNIGWKLLSLLVAFGLWFVVMSSTNIEITKEVAVEIETPKDLVVASEVPDRVAFRLSGSKFFLRTVANSLDTIRVDLTRAKAGPAYFRFDRESIHLPIGVRVLSISPTSIQPVLEPVERKSVPVELHFVNKLPPGYRILKSAAVPPRVKLVGPGKSLAKIFNLRSEPIDLSEIPVGLKWDLPIVLDDPKVKFEEAEEPKVLVELEPTGSNFRVGGVPIVVEGRPKKFEISADKVALFVSCRPELLKGLTPAKVKAWVKVPSSKPGAYDLPVEVELPDGVKLVKTVPQKVQVKVLE